MLTDAASGGDERFYVVDTNALIHGSHQLAKLSDTFYTIPEVLAEVKDRQTKLTLGIMPFEIVVREPSPEALAAGEPARAATHTGNGCRPPSVSL